MCHLAREEPDVTSSQDQREGRGPEPVGRAALIASVGGQRGWADWANPEHRVRRLLAEFLGMAGLTFILSGGAAILVRYGGEPLQPWQTVAVLSAVSALWLVVAVYFLGDISAHFNPVTTLAFALVLMVLNLANGPKLNGPFVPLAVGAYIMAWGTMGGPYDGASMNPARSFGPDLAIGDLSTWWIYLVGPVAGAIIAVGVAYVLRGPAKAQEAGAAVGTPLDRSA